MGAAIIVVVIGVVLALISKARRKVVEAKAARAIEIEPIFNGNYREFIHWLDIPLLPGKNVSNEDAQKCGRHIERYLVHNEKEGALFVEGVAEWCRSDSLDAMTAAEMERDVGGKGKVHLTAYRALEAVMTNNKNLNCFDSIDYGKLIGYRASLELKEAMGTLPGGLRGRL
ncbi:hypothetical protein [Sinorhizobium meliloti]|uniref:hypothetical protein n=1 Tax=Rhizobium meliloti TaxID=382 RepID=UPI000FDC717B|nr:hypothetical protein [Sinorhizobium meliloti]RVP20797.1 hypothetical protein CN080_21205 [Sinorhizobium meliloti]